MRNLDTETIVMLLPVVGFFLTAITIKLVVFFRRFSAEMRRINTEICRTDGREQSYWIQRKRRLWLSLIPFVRYEHK